MKNLTNLEFAILNILYITNHEMSKSDILERLDLFPKPDLQEIGKILHKFFNEGLLTEKEVPNENSECWVCNCVFFMPQKTRELFGTMYEEKIYCQK